MSEKLSEKTEKFGEDATNASQSSVGLADRPLEETLARLPTRFREELARQYDLPDNKISIIDILRYATPLEVVMMIVGTVMAIVAGNPTPQARPDRNSRRYTPVHDYPSGEVDQYSRGF
jgi:hypothetical protein